MKRILASIVLAFFAVFFSVFGYQFVWSKIKSLENEPEFEVVTDEELNQTQNVNCPLGLCNWQRPEGPLKVALQVGHWKNNELPDELEKLRGVSLGTSGGGKMEWEVCLEIAQLTKELLEAKGVLVDILPATVPIHYYADLFIAIHADGNSDTRISGYKAAGSYRDFTAKTDEIVKIFEEEYGKATQMILDDRITGNMRGYYAFKWWKYNHAVHPMAPSIIVETGFLTNKKDQQILIFNPEKSAKGIANTVIRYFNL